MPVSFLSQDLVLRETLGVGVDNLAQLFLWFLESSFSHWAWCFQFLAKTGCPMEVLTPFCGSHCPCCLWFKMSVHKCWGDIMALEEVVSLCKEQLFQCFQSCQVVCCKELDWIFEILYGIESFDTTSQRECSRSYCTKLATTPLTKANNCKPVEIQQPFFWINMLEISLLGWKMWMKSNNEQLYINHLFLLMHCKCWFQTVH